MLKYIKSNPKKVVAFFLIVKYYFASPSARLRKIGFLLYYRTDQNHLHLHRNIVVQVGKRHRSI